MTVPQTVVFAGPTIGLREAHALLDADYRPPARRGDVRHAVRAGARRIGLIDGCMKDVRAETPKDLLEALDHGIRIFGAASLGALLAAELDACGMVGVGRIYEDYRTGRLDRDDEVVVLHGPAELGYPALSEALVNVRATVSAAQAAGIVATVGERLLEAGRALHYPERTWPAILDRSAASGADHAEIHRFERWLPGGRVDQKRRDACALLKLMRADGASRSAMPSRPGAR